MDRGRVADRAHRPRRQRRARRRAQRLGGVGVEIGHAGRARRVTLRCAEKMKSTLHFPYAKSPAGPIVPRLPDPWRRDRLALVWTGRDRESRRGRRDHVTARQATPRRTAAGAIVACLRYQVSAPLPCTTGRGGERCLFAAAVLGLLMRVPRRRPARRRRPPGGARRTDRPGRSAARVQQGTGSVVSCLK